MVRLVSDAGDGWLVRARALYPDEAAPLRARHRRLPSAGKEAGNKDEALQADADNLMSALETALEDGDTEAASHSASRSMTVAGGRRTGDVAIAYSAGCRAARGRTRERLESLYVAANLALLAADTVIAASLVEQASSLIDEGPVERALALLIRSRVQIVRFNEPGDAESWLQEALGLVQIEARHGSRRPLCGSWASWQTAERLRGGEVLLVGKPGVL